MKVLLFGIAFAVFGTACTQQKPASAASTQSAPAATAAAHFSCPMHPEITGKAGDKCPKCNMDLKPVKK